jgi:eukaryotic-like serine/threonine-protein kinase
VKICPVCSGEFPSERTHCSRDGVALVALNTGATTRPEELIGHTVDGRYRIERIVGKGGMGTVYACRHVVVGKIVAMKVLRAGVERSEGVLQRFIREAQTANAVRSRHIVEMSDFGQLPNGCFYIVMELLEGQDLTRAMKSGALGTAHLTHVFVQVAETLHLAHAQGIVHRDLKPDNVFLVNESDDPLFVKLLDFGIAKILHQQATALTETGVILGTPYYMSPEQARADTVDHRSDIYALGVMMYRAFTGKLPFVADSTMGVLTRHLTEAPQAPSQIVKVEPALERVILKCLEKRPENRFQTMNEVAQALRGRLQVRALRDEPTTQESVDRMGPHHTPSMPGGPGPSGFAQSGAHGAWASGRTPYSGGYPVAQLEGHGYGPHVNTPPPGELTSRALATSSTNSFKAVPRRGPLFVVFGAVVMALAGAGLAVGIFSRPAGTGTGSAPEATLDPPARASAPTEPPLPATAQAEVPTPASSASTAFTPAASASASAQAGSPTSAAGIVRRNPPSPPRTAVPPPTAAPPATTPPGRRPEIRDPFAE